MAATSRRNNGRLFDTAPSRNLRFPQIVPVTATEILTLLPNTIRSHDMIFRLASNGMTAKAAAAIMNYFRTPPPKGPITQNTLCITFQNVMRERGTYQWQSNGVTVEWSLKNHRKFDAQGQQWDHRNLALTGLHPDLNHPNDLIDNVPFRELANGVQRFPAVSTGDGLNLTRCVLYARDHPNEHLLFPRDFMALTQRLGAIPVQAHHEDGETFKRWNDGTPPAAVQQSMPGAVQALIPAPVQPPVPAFVQPPVPGPVQPPIPGPVQPARPGSIQPAMPGSVHPLNRPFIQLGMPGQPVVSGLMPRPRQNRVQRSMAVQAPPVAARQLPALPTRQEMMRPGPTGRTAQLPQVDDDNLRMAQETVDRWFGAAARTATTARIIESQSRQDNDGDVQMTDDDLANLFGPPAQEAPVEQDLSHLLLPMEEGRRFYLEQLARQEAWE
jgi:hypothetical protein